MSEGALFLGVESSLTGRSWRFRPADPAWVRGHQQRHSLSEPIARALAGRGVSPDTADDYLNPSLKRLFPDPSSFLGMDQAAAILVEALTSGRKTFVFADYDVDGASSAALLVRWFRAMGADLPVYVPDRVTEGYGPTALAFDRMAAQGAELVVTVDCGAAAYDALAHAAEIGLPVVVIDHHLMKGAPPAAAALVNPNQPGCGSGQGGLAAAGVTFVLLAALNREARRRGLFASASEPDLKSWLDLAALGAICDVTPLTGFNRALASLGLKVMSRWQNPGLSALAETAGKPAVASTFTAGFLLGPRINAGGRIGRADLGARLLSTDVVLEAQDLAMQLDHLNSERREVERAVLEAAIDQIERSSNLPLEAPILIAAAEDWHPGVIGIVAGRLRERWRKPVIVIGIDPVSRIAKGSGRSQPGVNLGKAIQDADAAGLLIGGGGHAMAAGLTVRADRIPELRAFLEDRLREEQAEAAAQDALEIDALVGVEAASRPFLEAFSILEPYGPGNPEPILAWSHLKVGYASALNGGHVRAELQDEAGRRIKAIAWRCADTALGRRLLQGGASLHVVGKLKADDYQGRRGVQIEIEDAADPRQRS